MESEDTQFIDSIESEELRRAQTILPTPIPKKGGRTRRAYEEFLAHLDRRVGAAKRRECLDPEQIIIDTELQAHHAAEVVIENPDTKPVKALKNMDLTPEQKDLLQAYMKKCRKDQEDFWGK